MSVFTLGSVRQIADASGNVILTESYEPYGTLLNSSGNGQSVYGFTGEERDASGLTYLRARYMQPRLGMFLSHDPANGNEMQPGSMNGWNYVGGNPINFTDPNGLQGEIVICQQNPQLCEAIRQAVEAGVATIVGVVEASATTTLVTVGGIAVGGTGIVILALFSPQQKMWPPPVPAPAPPKTRPAYPPIGTVPPSSVGDPGGTQGPWNPNPAPAPKPVPVPEPNCNPNPGPQIDPVYPRIPTATPTERPERKHIALGLNGTLGSFFANLYVALRPQNISVYVWGEWQKAGLSDVYPGSGAAFVLGFGQASTRAERIHFNLEGISGNINDYAQEYGSYGLTGDSYYTAYELYSIKTRGLCAKTDFYENGSQGLSPSPRKQQLCGGQ